MEVGVAHAGPAAVLPGLRWSHGWRGRIERAIRPIVLESRRKAVNRDNGYRVVQPEVTLGRYGHHVSPITGAVSMLERVGPAASLGRRRWGDADACLRRRT